MCQAVSGDSALNDVSLLIGSLLDFNELPFDSKFFDFEGENIIVWSDEDDKEKIYSIRLTQQEFAAQLEVAKQELQGFIKKVEVWTLENYQTDPNRLFEGISHYLFFEYR